MMRLLTTRNVTIIVIVLISVWLGLQIPGSYRVIGPEIPLELISENVDLTLKNIKYTKNRAGELLWTLVADSAAHSMEDGSTRVKNVHIVFFDGEVVDVELTADLGKLMPESRTVTVTSNVKVTSASGNTLQTDYLEFEETGNVLQTDRMVKINADNFVASGRGMQIDIEERILTLLNDVKAQIDGIKFF